MGNLVVRSQRVAFMNTGTAESPAFTRMTQFTNMSNSKNPKEYNRNYVDELTETSDVVGYSPSTEYSFDKTTENLVQEKLSKIHDGELVGADTHVEIVVVDLYAPGSVSGSYKAYKRTWAVIPGADGDGTDALIYSGTFKSVSKIEEGTATLTDNNQTAVFTPATPPTE